MNEKITAELDLPGVGLGAGVTVGCLLACYSEPMVRCVWLFISAAVLAFSLFTGKRRFLAAGLLLGLVSMTVYQTWYAGSLQALAGSGIRAQCRIISVNYSNDRWSAGRALCVLDGKPALIDITCDSVLDDSRTGNFHVLGRRCAFRRGNGASQPQFRFQPAVSSRESPQQSR